MGTQAARIVELEAEVHRLKTEAPTAGELGLFAAYLGPATVSPPRKGYRVSKWGSASKAELLEHAEAKAVEAQVEAAARATRKTAQRERRDERDVEEAAKRETKRARVDHEAPLVARLRELGWVAADQDTLRLADVNPFVSANKIRRLPTGRCDRVEALLALLPAQGEAWVARGAAVPAPAP